MDVKIDNIPKEAKIGAGKRGPYYLEVAQQLRDELASGAFKPGQRFHSIRDLIRRTNRSLPTVRSAINLLVEEELITSRPGSGLYVTGIVGGPRFGTISQMLVVIPSYVVPNESIFTGQIVSGIIDATQNRNTIVSVYRRQAVLPFTYDRKVSGKDLENILAARPDAVAWLHALPQDKPILSELKKRDLPVATTIRSLPEVDLPRIREDDLIYAAIVLSQFHARGHRRIGVVTRNPESDDYFSSKIDALIRVARSLNMQVDESDRFISNSNLVDFDRDMEELGNFIEERPDLDALLLLASNSIIPVAKLMGGAMSERVSAMSIVLNVLDGLKIPKLPSGESLAMIHPPLEELGKRLAEFLLGGMAGRHDEEARPLISCFRPGNSLKFAKT